MTTAEEGEPLRRDIGFFGASFLAFNGLVGAGIFVLPGTLHARFGTLAPWLFPAYGLLALGIVVPYARVARHFGRTGGPVAYAESLGPFAAFQAGWIYWVARAAAFAANLNILVAYLATLVPAFSGPSARAALILAAVAAIAAVNIAGVRRAIRLLNLLTLLKAAPLIAAALLALAWYGPPPAPSGLPEAGALEASALLILYAFVGFETAVVAAGETADARRTIPRALILTVIGTALLYMIVQLGYSAAMPAGPAGDAPLVAWGERLIGPAGATLLTLAAIASLLGNVSGGITGTARTSYAMARDGLLPPVFAQVSPRYATPVPSILVLSGLVALLALSGSFVWLAVMSTLARMIVYALGIATLPRLERGPLAWPLALTGLTLCAWAAAPAGTTAWLTLLAIAGVGTAIFAVGRTRR